MEKSRIDALMEEYEHFAENMAFAVFSANKLFYSALGIEREDLFQEALVGLYKAILNYNSNFQTSFKTFASKCIKNEILSAVRSALSGKNMVLSSAASLEDFDKEISGPEDEVIFKDLLSGLLKGTDANLSKMETAVAKALAEGKTCKEIALELGKSPKSISNAVQRLRGKISEFIS